MTTYVICDKCKGKFKSQYQIKNLKANLIQENKAICPLCNQVTLVENRNMINE